MAIGSTQSASSQKMDFMNLLVTQLQNQNPLEPMDNQDMSAQLAQFSQLEQLENLNQNFGQVLETTERSLANDMLGKQVSFIDLDATDAQGVPGVTRTGQVMQMNMVGDTEMLRITEVDPKSLIPTEYTIDAGRVTSILNPYGS